jgi:hypothetical protein
MWPLPWGQSTATIGANDPPRTYVAPYLPAGPVNRHLGMHCICALIDCCHNEMPEDGYAFKGGFHAGHHMDSGSPASGYLYPWEPGDEPWRDGEPIPAAAGVTISGRD